MLELAAQQPGFLASKAFAEPRASVPLFPTGAACRHSCVAEPLRTPRSARRRQAHVVFQLPGPDLRSAGSENGWACRMKWSGIFPLLSSGIGRSIHFRPMRGQLAGHARSLSPWSRGVVWTAAFFSPTVYFLLLILVDRLHVPAPPDVLVVAMFCLVPIVALGVCGTMAWQSTQSTGKRVSWLALTVLGLVLQLGALFVIIVSALTATISPAQ